MSLFLAATNLKLRSLTFVVSENLVEKFEFGTGSCIFRLSQRSQSFSKYSRARLYMSGDDGVSFGAKEYTTNPGLASIILALQNRSASILLISYLLLLVLFRNWSEIHMKLFYGFVQEFEHRRRHR